MYTANKFSKAEKLLNIKNTSLVRQFLGNMISVDNATNSQVSLEEKHLKRNLSDYWQKAKL